MKHWISRCLLGIAFLHTVFAVVVLGPFMLSMLRAGLFNSVKSDTTAGVTAWFFLFGILLALLALPLHALEKAGMALPKPLGWGLFGLAVLGVVLMPDSGFWLVFPPALAIMAGKSGARIGSAAA
jgi:hypothetical protein